jgi:hypothetical protein
MQERIRTFATSGWAKLGLFLSSLVAALLLAEIGLRVFAPVHLASIQHAYRYDAELGYRLKQGIHVFEATDHQEEIRVNEVGTVNFQGSFAQYAVKIFALGDSFTQGTGLPADASYPFQLDLALNLDSQGRYDKTFAVANLGLAAFGGEQSLLTLRRYAGLIGAPNFVLYLGSENDAEDDALFLRGDRHRQLVEGNPRYGAALAPLRWLAATELGKRGKLALRSMQKPPPIAGTAAARGPSVAEQQRGVLERLASQSRELGAVLVVSWSDPESPSYAWLKAWADKNGVAFADWLPAVQSVSLALPTLPWRNQHSGGHFRSWVNRLIAEAYAQQVRASPRQAQ